MKLKKHVITNLLIILSFEIVLFAMLNEGYCYRKLECITKTKLFFAF